MLREKKRVMGELAAYQVAAISGMLTGKMPNVDQLNPYRVVDLVESDELRKLREWKRKRAIEVLVREMNKKAKGE